MNKHYSKRVPGYFKRRFKHFWYSNKIEINKTQLKTAAICRMALRNSESELMINPVNEKRIIDLPTAKLYIVLENSVADISNGKFKYQIQLHHTLYLKITKMFDHKLDTLIQDKENIRTNHLVEGLDTLLKSIV